MPIPVIAWAVELGPQAAPDDVKGTLALEDDALTFSPADQAHPLARIPLASISKVRRLRGTPVLLVVHGSETAVWRTAFYFVQPPPLGALMGQSTERPAGLAALRNPKRRARRDNVGYLGMTNREKKALLAEWVSAVRTAAGTA